MVARPSTHHKSTEEMSLENDDPGEVKIDAQRTKKDLTVAEIAKAMMMFIVISTIILQLTPIFPEIRLRFRV